MKKYHSVVFHSADDEIYVITYKRAHTPWELMSYARRSTSSLLFDGEWSVVGFSYGDGHTIDLPFDCEFRHTTN